MRGRTGAEGRGGADITAACQSTPVCLPGDEQSPGEGGAWQGACRPCTPARRTGPILGKEEEAIQDQSVRGGLKREDEELNTSKYIVTRKEGNQKGGVESRTEVPEASMQLQHRSSPFIEPMPARVHHEASAVPSRSPCLPHETHVQGISALSCQHRKICEGRDLSARFLCAVNLFL